MAPKLGFGKFRIVMQIPGGEFELFSYKAEVTLDQAEKKAWSFAAMMGAGWLDASDRNICAIDSKDKDAMILVLPMGIETTCAVGF